MNKKCSYLLLSLILLNSASPISLVLSETQDVSVDKTSVQNPVSNNSTNKSIEQSNPEGGKDVNPDVIDEKRQNISVQEKVSSQATPNSEKTNKGVQGEAASLKVGDKTNTSKADQVTSQATDIATGVYGTVSWRIDNSGTLFLSAGALSYVGRPVWTEDIYRNQITRVVLEGPIEGSGRLDFLFSEMSNLQEIQNLTFLDISKVVSMWGMFMGSSSLTSLDLTNFDTRNVSVMASMFSRCRSLRNVDVSAFDTWLVSDMSNMFYECSSLTNLDVSHFNMKTTSNVIGLFDMCTNLVSVKLPVLKEEALPLNVLRGCDNLKKLTIQKDSDMTIANLPEGVDTKKWGTISDNTSYSSIELMKLYAPGKVTKTETFFKEDGQIILKNNSLIEVVGKTLNKNDFLNNVKSLVNRALQDTTDIDKNMVEIKCFDQGSAMEIPMEQMTNKAGVYDVIYNYQGANAALTLTVKDKPILYTIRYEGNGADRGTMNDQQFTYDVPQKLNKNTFERDGYTFAGWKVKTKGAAVDYTDEQEVNNLSQTDGEVVTLVAQWNPVPELKAPDRTYTMGSTITDDMLMQGVTATDFDGDDIVGSVVMDRTDLDPTKPGIYTITYRVVDKNGGEFIYESEITIKDKPSITALDKVLKVGDKVDDAVLLKDVTATDVDGKDITGNLKVLHHTVDTSVPGDYTVTYEVTDEWGGKIEKTINLRVEAQPVINSHPTISAQDKVFILGDKVDDAAILSGATAADKEDGDITNALKIVKNAIDSSKAGKYEVVLEVTDKDGASTRKQIFVTIKEQEKVPVPESSTPSANNKGEVTSSEKENERKVFSKTVEKLRIKREEIRSKKQVALPKTGEQVTYTLSLLGIGILLALCFVFIRRRKRK